MKDETSIDKAIRSAWIWLLLTPVGALIGQLAGHLVAWAFGQKEDGPLTVSWWKALLIIAPATVLTVAPAFVSMKLGFHMRKGQRIGWMFLVVGGLICLLFVAVAILTSFGVAQ